MEILRTSNVKDAENYASEYMNNKECLIIHTTPDDTHEVLSGTILKLYNNLECSKKNIVIANGYYLGGTIVNMPGDVSLCLITYYNTDYAKGLIKVFLKYFDDNNIKYTQDKNDILINNKKVISYAKGTSKEGWHQNVVHFSIGDMNLDLVDRICRKPMVKIPGSLKEVGITTEDIMMIINEYNKVIF